MTKQRLLLAVMLCVVVLGLVFGIQAPSPAMAQDFGTGTWSTIFYNSTDFTNQVAGVSPTYSQLNFNWPSNPLDASGSALTTVAADNFSAIFTSNQTLAAGTYTFTLVADDWAQLTINGIAVVETSTPNVAASNQATLPGGTVSMQVRLREYTGEAILQAFWTLSGTGNAGGVVGTAITSTPTVTPLPTITPLPAIPAGALTATVIRAGVLNVRDAPSLGGNRIGQILRGQTYAVLGRNNDATWFLIQLAGYQGWVYGYYIFTNRNEFQAPIVSGNTVLGLGGLADTGVRGQVVAGLRMRQGPSVATVQSGRLSWGAFIPILGRTADGYWYQTVWRESVGWVYAPFVDIVEGNLANVPIKTG